MHYHAQKAGKEAGGTSSNTGGVGCSVRGCLKFSLLNRGPHFSPEVTVTLALAAYVSFVSLTHKVILQCRIHTISSLPLSHSLRSPSSTDCYLVYVLSLFGQCQNVYRKCELVCDIPSELNGRTLNFVNRVQCGTLY